MTENAKLLVKALRSGKYKQGKGNLRNIRDEFCCLGVACDLYNEQTGKGYWETTKQPGDGIYWFITPGTPAEISLPGAVRKWLGFNDSLGIYGKSEIPGTLPSLAADNDAGKTFDEIATIIETQTGLYA